MNRAEGREGCSATMLLFQRNTATEIIHSTCQKLSLRTHLPPRPILSLLLEFSRERRRNRKPRNCGCSGSDCKSTCPRDVEPCHATEPPTTAPKAPSLEEQSQWLASTCTVRIKTSATGVCGVQQLLSRLKGRTDELRRTYLSNNPHDRPSTTS